MQQTLLRLFYASVLFFPGLMQAQSVLTVTNTGDTGMGSLRQTITDASAGDTIVFDAAAQGYITLASEITIDKNITVKGPGRSSLTISGDNSTRLFSVNSGVTLRLSNITLENGRDNSSPGGAINNSGNLYLHYATIQNCNGAYGGAIHNSSMLSLYDCMITSNTSGGDGGAVYNTGTVYLKKTELSYNTASNGAGIFNTNQIICDSSSLLNNSGGGISSGFGTITISNSKIKGNTTFASGGALYLYEGTTTISNTEIADNSAGFGQSGGGIYCTGNGNTTVRNSYIHQNYASSGGGISVYSGSLRVDTSRINNNSGGAVMVQSGGTVHINASYMNDNNVSPGGVVHNYGTTEVHASTIANNSVNLDGGTFINHGTLTLSRSTISANSASGTGSTILNNAGSISLSNCTFYQSTPGQAGIVNHSVLITTASLFWNTSLTDDGTLTSNGYNFSNDASYNFSGTGDSNSVDMTLGPLQDNGGATTTHALPNCGAAINAGPVADNSKDQRGVSISGGFKDIGAFESQLASTPVAPTISQGTNCNSDQVSTISNYNAALTYAFTPSGPSVNSSGVVTDAELETIYTVTASEGGCTSVSSQGFSNLAQLSLEVNATLGSSTLMAVENGASYQWLDCNNSYAIIANAIAQSYAVTADGNYAVEITKGVCKDTSTCIIVTNTEEEHAQQVFSLYPNPAQHEVYLQASPAFIHESYHLTDAYGNVVVSGTLTTDIQKIPLENIAAGLYCLQVGNSSQKLIIE